MKAGEYAISKDLNVALWEEFMKNSKKKTLQEIYGGDFVIINEELHGQFDEFKKNIVPANHTCSTVPVVELLEYYWCKVKCAVCSVHEYCTSVWKIICEDDCN